LFAKYDSISLFHVLTLLIFANTGNKNNYTQLYSVAGLILCYFLRGQFVFYSEGESLANFFPLLALQLWQIQMPNHQSERKPTPAIHKAPKVASKSVAATILMKLEKNSASLQMPMHK
jgi:hypothetical protein